jgi:hypothetical protein
MPKVPQQPDPANVKECDSYFLLESGGKQTARGLKKFIISDAAEESHPAERIGEQNPR